MSKWRTFMSCWIYSSLLDFAALAQSQRNDEKGSARSMYAKQQATRQCQGAQLSKFLLMFLAFSWFLKLAEWEAGEVDYPHVLFSSESPFFFFYEEKSCGKARMSLTTTVHDLFTTLLSALQRAHE